ncbi:SoxH protein [Rhodovulum sp. P5]|uniref:quinoprotein relay system zinc metallohydrolase 2 n=1 Tax=Rhodovulum sp. P5 TaxID=1564506 RepID=UPI0009C279D1|nr:quinoprotein relay system zinc metallohydrolase 2 [Rhodovulum sp. P5]ARE39101.1 SoxH protein [Rhodovulum sp. P5]
MFEAVLTLCLAGAEAECRSVLLPGYEAATMADCTAMLADTAPDLDVFGADVIAPGAPRCQPAGPVLDLQEIAPRLWVHKGAIAEPDRVNGGDVSNIAVVIGDASVAVIDTGSARWMGESLWRAVRARTKLPVSHVILTHMHPDHVFGASVFDGARVVGHAGLARALADRQANYLESLASLIGADRLIGTAPPDIDLAIDGKMEIDLGGRVLELSTWPTAHTGNDLTVVDRVSGTLLAGDLVFDGHIPALDGSVTGWQAVLEQMAGQPPVRVVPGHGGPVLPWPAGGAATARYLGVLAADTRAAIADGLRLGAAVERIAQGERDYWQLFDAFNARNATVAYTELEWE